MRGYRVKRKPARPHGVQTERPASLAWSWDADGCEAQREEQTEEQLEDKVEEQRDGE